MNSRLVAVTLLFSLFAIPQVSLLGQIAESQVRVAAEWEPAIGVLIGWPLVLPEQLVVDLSKNERLFVVIETAEEKEAAAKKLSSLKIPPAQIVFVIGSSDNTNGPSELQVMEKQEVAKTASNSDNSKKIESESLDRSENDLYEKIHIWTRDWGPFAGFSNQKNYHLIDPIFEDYPLAKQTCESELIYFPGARKKDWNSDEVKSLGETLGVAVKKANAYFVGGNLMFDGQGTAMSTCVSLTENKSHDISRSQFMDVARSAFGVTNYHVIPNFEDLGIQHIDCLLKFLSEDRILVARPPLDSDLFDRYQEIVAQIAKLQNVHGRPYRIYRINCGKIKNAMENIGTEDIAADEDLANLSMEGIAAYTNSLILNKNIYVPLYGIDTDQAALETWRLVMPGYEVKGYVFTEESGSKIPWQSFDALHCRTRAIWDPEMLYMTHQSPMRLTQSAGETELQVKIIDYSRKGLIDDALILNYRGFGQSNWKQINLDSSAPNIYSAVLTKTTNSRQIEYYFSAASESGRKENLPRTAPDNFYRLQRY